MNAHRASLRQMITAHPWRTAIVGLVVLLYVSLLACVATTMSLSAESDASRYVAQTARRLAGPLPEFPVMHTPAWPDLTMQRNPFQPVTAATNPAMNRPLESSTINRPSQPVRFVASFQDSGTRYAVGRSSAGDLAQFKVGDKVDDGVIESIDQKGVHIRSAAHQQTVEILAEKREDQ